jgi:hypothetical protein
MSAMPRLTRWVPVTGAVAAGLLSALSVEPGTDTGFPYG